jgi:2-oxoglutarate dehydrogenase E2 component (dihydrolipoamide succinyltransferase)
MGVSVSEGTIVAWRKQAGDPVAYEETICEISTDKIDTEVPSPAAGRVTELLVEVGATVEVGTVLARIATDDAAEPPPPPATSEAAAATGDSPAPATDHAAPAPEVAAVGAPSSADGDGAGDGRRYSPVVQRIAAEHGIDLARVAGTGRGGRVRKQDVLAVVEGAGAERAGGGERPGGGRPGGEPPLHIESPYRPEPPAARPAATGAPQRPAAAPGAEGGLSRMRRAIGAHMKRSLDTAATCTTWIEADVSRVEEARARLGLTALPFVARATVEALRAFPALNATLDGDAYTRHDGVHLGIAVSLGDDGLIVPVVRDAQDLSAEGLARRIKDVARRARARELLPDDVQGGTFTITNPGQFGSLMATPVINQPQVAILDVEAVVKRPVVVTGPAGEDAIAIRPMCILGLSWDHRALDGALAAQFLADLRDRLERL